jgi:hypothetical protein
LVFDEQELRHHLVAVADLVDQPCVTVDGLIARVRRRRAKVIGLFSGALLTVVAIAVGVPIGLGSGTGLQVTSHQAEPKGIPFRPSYTVALNGQSRTLPKNGPLPSFAVTAGKEVKISVGVTVPPHATVTALWLGIAGDVSGVGRDGPTGVHPVLAHIRKPLTSGKHSFMLEWTVPDKLQPGTLVYLNATWAGAQATVGQAIASLVVTSQP